MRAYVFIILFLFPFFANGSPLTIRTGEYQGIFRCVIDLNQQVVNQPIVKTNKESVIVFFTNVLNCDAGLMLIKGSSIIKECKINHSSGTKLSFKTKGRVKVRHLLLINGENSKLILDLEPIINKSIKKKPIIVIDPGHGGIDSGTSGSNGITEKYITLAVAKEIKQKLKNKCEIVLTRETDKFLNLKQRVDISKKSNGDLFISLHVDNNPNKQIKGISIYTLSSTPSDYEARMFEERENKNDTSMIGTTDNPDIALILDDLTGRETQKLSEKFASVMIKNINQHYLMKPKAHRSANLKVLKALNIPSVLIELGCISNSEDEVILKTPSSRSKIVNNIIKAINKYFLERCV